MSGSYSIGQLSKLTGCKVTTIRWYEKEGLLPEAARSEGNQRRYNQRHLMTLRFIRHARELGFDLSAVRQLQHLSQCDKHDCHEADRIASNHLQTVRQRIQSLQALEAELEAMIDRCQQGDASHCQVLEVLADHGLCQHEHLTESKPLAD